MKKILYTATVDGHIKAFHIPYLKMMKEHDYETHVASNGESKIDYCDVKYNVPFERNPFKFNNIKAYKQLKKIINENQFDIIHCHTPVGGILTRLAARRVRKKGTRVIYTAHGFHFFKGASIINWLLYYPIEKLCSKYTDTLITINKEDYDIAVIKMKAKNILYLPGVGLDIEKINSINVDKEKKREEIEIPRNSIMLLSVGELNNNKNHELVINAMSRLPNYNIHYVIVGSGDLIKYLKDKSNNLEMSDKIHFLGFRSDVYELCKAADVFCFPSMREGLSVALMEAMASGLPCVVSKIRGNVDLIEDGVNGYLFENNDIDSFIEAINKIIINFDVDVIEKISKNNIEKIKKFDYVYIVKQMKNLYFKI